MLGKKSKLLRMSTHDLIIMLAGADKEFLDNCSSLSIVCSYSTVDFFSPVGPS